MEQQMFLVSRNKNRGILGANIEPEKAREVVNAVRVLEIIDEHKASGEPLQVAVIGPWKIDWT